MSDYVYGTYYGYGYCYHFDAMNSQYVYGYGFGNITGYHWIHYWRNIDINQYTENAVKDITYRIKLYQLDAKNNIISKKFATLDEGIKQGYLYFKPEDIIVQKISDSYYMTPTDKRMQYHK